MGNTMEQEIERIFRVMALLLPHAGLHDAYVGLRSANPVVRANAIEFLDNVLKPELRQVLVPVIDSQVTVAEKIVLADRLVGAPLATPEQSIETLLGSEDPWLRSCAVYAIGAMQLETLEPELDRFEHAEDPAMRQTVQNARRRLAGHGRRGRRPGTCAALARDGDRRRVELAPDLQARDRRSAAISGSGPPPARSRRGGASQNGHYRETHRAVRQKGIKRS